MTAEAVTKTLIRYLPIAIMAMAASDTATLCAAGIFATGIFIRSSRGRPAPNHIHGHSSGRASRHKVNWATLRENNVAAAEKSA